MNPGDSVGVAENDGNVMASYTGSNYKPTAYPNSTWFAPYVTGIPPVGHDPGWDNDNDDGATIASNMCLSVQLLARGNAAACYCLTGDPSCLSPSTVTVTQSGPCEFPAGP